jgi:hypothetical protein
MMRLSRALRKLDLFEAILIDDIGYVQQSPEEAEALFTLLAERYERRSVMITSNLVFSQWERIFKDQMANGGGDRPIGPSRRHLGVRCPEFSDRSQPTHAAGHATTGPSWTATWPAGDSETTRVTSKRSAAREHGGSPLPRQTRQATGLASTNWRDGRLAQTDRQE